MEKKPMSDDNLIEILGVDCKNTPSSRHNTCPSMWEGYGFIIFCKCECHKIKINAIDGKETPMYIAGAVVENG
jgi:hypothetical protein